MSVVLLSKKGSSTKTRIILVDVSPLMCRALRECIEKQQNMEVIGEAGDGQEAIELASKLLPDIVVIDIDSPIVNVIEATKQRIEKCPHCKILVFLG